MTPLGEVARNDDPLEKARVRVRVPGKFDPYTDWLIPLAPAGSSGQRGGAVTPKIGAKCLVLFADDNLSKGYYICVNEDAYSKDGETIFTFGDITFSIVEGKGIVLKAGEAKIEARSDTGTILVKSPYMVSIQATAIEMKAPDLTLNGRRVMPEGKPI